MIAFVDTFGDIVTEVSTAYSGTVYYEHGHPLDIVNTLAQKTKSSTYKNKKYPLIALFQDFREISESDNNFLIPEITVIIATQTNRNYTAAERYDNTFPTLYTIMDLLVSKLNTNMKTSWYKWDYEKWDRVFWGRQGLYGSEGNIFNDYIDAIEMRIKNIKTLKTC